MQTVSIFSKANYPTNLFDAREWRKFAHATSRNGGKSILAAQRQFAAHKGGAFYRRCDDALVVFTKRENGKITRRTFRPGTWKWEE